MRRLRVKTQRVPMAPFVFLQRPSKEKPPRPERLRRFFQAPSAAAEGAGVKQYYFSDRTQATSFLASASVTLAFAGMGTGPHTSLLPFST